MFARVQRINERKVRLSNRVDLYGKTPVQDDSGIVEHLYELI